MSLLIVFLAIAGVFCEEMVVTREYTDYLKQHVDWEVADYEDNIFRGWTIDEAKSLLIQEIPELDPSIPYFESDEQPPQSQAWSATCLHEVRDQGSCGSCWAFAVAGMLSDRCCANGHDYGWLAPQELVSCDRKDSGCQGGWPTWALEYVKDRKGLVHEGCFKYAARGLACQSHCDDGKDWTASHHCQCYDQKICTGVENMKNCLTSGPISVAFYVPQSFFSYKGGVYKCNGSSLGLHAVDATGHGTTAQGECYWRVRNSWGTSWGEQGYFDIACQTCGIDGSYPNGNVMCLKVE